MGNDSENSISLLGVTVDFAHRYAQGPGTFLIYICDISTIDFQAVWSCDHWTSSAHLLL